MLYFASTRPLKSGQSGNRNSLVQVLKDCYALLIPQEQPGHVEGHVNYPGQVETVQQHRECPAPEEQKKKKSWCQKNTHSTVATNIKTILFQYLHNNTMFSNTFLINELLHFIVYMLTLQQDGGLKYGIEQITIQYNRIVGRWMAAWLDYLIQAGQQFCVSTLCRSRR